MEQGVGAVRPVGTVSSRRDGELQPHRHLHEGLEPRTPRPAGPQAAVIGLGAGVVTTRWRE